MEEHELEKRSFIFYKENVFPIFKYFELRQDYHRSLKRAVFRSYLIKKV